MLNPNWLTTFRTLIETGHFTKTAEKLFMTQPGVSQHIRKLEQACGHDLIRRDKKSFEITEQGRLVYEYASQLEQAEADLLENLNFDDPHSGHCRLSCSGSLALLLYSGLLELQCEHLGLVVHLEAAPNKKILNEIIDGDIDLGIVTHVPNPSLFDIEKIGSEVLCLVYPSNKNIGEDISESLVNMGLIRHPDVMHYLSLYAAQCGVEGIKAMELDDVPASGYVNQLNQILLPVSKGLGFTVLPQSAIEKFEHNEKLKVYQPNREVSETLYLVRKRNRELPARFATIIQKLKAILC
ncbi:LysR family transcriptional regulator [Vibrio hannami]|uniref:LysR family transcriptional regulator n=1 Tax=Vibrio hannami TaxID=2717094 RepID=UPI00240F083A|nr:LysR family transcriptional regulator [Vibrio hannami]MDG3084976.1 LysR family transcriptional regulator [Vibrio hannami]